jgi:hypothetical protein
MDERKQAMVIKYIIGRTDDRTVRTERIKMMAGGCQLIAIGIFVAAIVAPIFNPSLPATLKSHAMGGVGFALFELLALRIMGYIPPNKED